MRVKELKKKNLVGVLGGWLALVGMFLPYVNDISFFQSLTGPEYGFFAPCLTLCIASATILYALGLEILPHILSLVLLVICALFPGYSCFVNGVSLVLPRLQIGAGVLLGGLLMMGLHPFFSSETPS